MQWLEIFDEFVRLRKAETRVNGTVSDLGTEQVDGITS